MLAGHLAVGLAGKRIHPEISLGSWMTAALLSDLLAFLFMIAGREHFRPLAGVTSNRMLGDIQYSHSLLLNALWAALLAGGFYLLRRDRRGAGLLAAVVLTHWVLDVISHRPDMALAPGVGPLLGFGLWNSFPAALLVEGGLWLAAIVLYSRATKPANWAGRLMFWLGIALFTLAWMGNIRAGIDLNPVRAGANGLIFFSLIIAWAYWMNRARYFKISSK